MERLILASDKVVAAYRELFVNRLAYTVQSSKPHQETGRHYYYRPRRNEQAVSLTLDTIRRHLEGKVTIGLYAVNPQTQRSKWVAIDADYENAIEDLLKLQWELRQDGVEAALERSRRGGHLWIFAQTPLLARDCRVYIYNLARRLKVPVKGAKLAEGIEVFPRQDTIPAGEFGNAIRGPLGVHQAVRKRFWFYSANYALEAQMAYLLRIRKISDQDLEGFIRGLKMPEEFEPKPKANQPLYRTGRSTNRPEFRILDHVIVKRKSGRNYWTRCPSCARQHHDRSGDNLAISVADPRKYKCWAGCSREMIREAVGCPIRASTSLVEAVRNSPLQ
jgi:hypothetical protein